MRVAFLEPPAEKGKNPVDRVYGCNYRMYPKINIHALVQATFIRDSGHDVDILDYSIQDNGMDEFQMMLKPGKYDAYVIFSVFLSEKHDVAVGKRIREADNDAFIIYNGTAPTWEPGNYIFDDKVIAVRGEPELILKDVITRAADKGRQDIGFDDVKGITYLKDGEVVDNPTAGIISDLDILPIPDRRLLPEGFFDPRLGGKTTTLFTSRRCNFRCYYCVGNALSLSAKIEYRKHFGKNPPPSKRSVENVIKEFKDVAELGYTSVDVLDDRFIWGKERTLKICDEIAPLGLQLFIRERADLIDEDIAKALYNAGAKHIALGVESFNQDSLDYCKKDLDVNKVYEAVDVLKKQKFNIELNMLLGSCPVESREEIDRSLKEAERLNPDYLLYSICAPYPGTEFYDLCKENNWIIGDIRETDPQWKAIVDFPKLEHGELETLIKKHWRYYFKPKYILRQIAKSSPRKILEKARTAVTFLKLYLGKLNR